MPEKKLPWEPYEKYWPYLIKVAKRLVIEGLLSEKQIADVAVSRTYTCYYGIGVTYISVTVSYSNCSNCSKLILSGEIRPDTNTFRVLFTPWDKRFLDTILEVVIPLTATKKEAIQLVEDSILAARL